MQNSAMSPAWQEWIRHNWPALRGTRHEALFVRSVLSQVPGLDPAICSTQVPFTDLRGGSRRMDFAIVPPFGQRIAIEVDGYDKTGRGAGMSREEFEDWSLRELSLTAQGWKVLRFANSLVEKSPHACARTITVVLNPHEQMPVAPPVEPRSMDARPAPSRNSVAAKRQRRAASGSDALLRAAAGVAVLVVGLSFAKSVGGADAAIKRQPTPAPSAAQTQCDPSYPDVCIRPGGPDLDCEDIPHRNFKVLSPDTHMFDLGDYDGIGCEAPRR